MVDAKKKIKRMAMDTGFTLVMFFLFLAVLCTLGYQYTAKTITNPTFFYVYGLLGLIGLIYTGLSVFFYVFDKKWETAIEDEVASRVFMSDGDRPLATWWGRTFVWVLITLIVSLTVLGAGSVIGVPNPYNADSVSKSILEEHSLFLNIWNIAVYPGLFEEIVIFGFINALIFLMTFALSTIFKNDKLRKNYAVLIVCGLIATAFGVGVFVMGHSQAYGLNEGAYVSAFFFEFTVQIANQITGLFLSWIPHLLHNAIFILGEQTSFAIGGTFLLFFIDVKYFRMIRDVWARELLIFKYDFSIAKKVMHFE